MTVSLTKLLVRCLSTTAVFKELSKRPRSTRNTIAMLMRQAQCLVRTSNSEQQNKSNENQLEGARLVQPREASHR